MLHTYILVSMRHDVTSYTFISLDIIGHEKIVGLVNINYLGAMAVSSQVKYLILLWCDK